MKIQPLVVLLVFFVAAGAVAEASQLVIYSGRNERFVMPLIEAFQEETGIRVQLLSGDAAQYVHRLQAERNNPRADVFISNDGALLEVARSMDLLMANDSEALEAIPEQYRAPDGAWVGLAARTRVLMYNKDMTTEEEMPASVWDLADPQWHGQFLITRPGNASMVSHISALRVVHGDETTKNFLRGLMDNEPTIVRGHTDIRRAVGAGEYAFGLVNNYYYHLQLEEPRDNHVGAVYPDQGEGEMGAFVNVSGVGLVNGAPNAANALQFIDYLLQPEPMYLYSYNSRETPLVPDIEAVSDAKRIDEYRAAELPLGQLGPMYNTTLDLMEAAGFGE